MTIRNNFVKEIVSGGQTGIYDDAYNILGQLLNYNSLDNDQQTLTEEKSFRIKL